MIITYNIVYCVCDEEFDSFCCRFTTMSRVMEPGGCRIASPAWQTKSLGARRQYSQATVNNVLPLMTDSPAFLTWPPNIAHSAWMHSTLWNAIFASLIASKIDVIDTLRFNNDVDYLYRLATVLQMRLNHEYWCEPECTWQTSPIQIWLLLLFCFGASAALRSHQSKKAAQSDLNRTNGKRTADEQYQQNSHKWKTWQLGFQTLKRYWASFQVTRLFHSATNFFNQADY